MKRAIVGMGSNLGDRVLLLQSAVEAFSRLPDTRVAALSHLYETTPVGYADQPDFLNSAALLETELNPEALLDACLGIEAEHGRERSFPNAPRTLDLDLLLYEGVRRKDERLTLPHPRMLERAFVLVPLMDLFPDGHALGIDLKPFLRSVGQSGVLRHGAELALLG